MFEFSCADFSFPLLTRYQTLSMLRLLDFHLVDLGLFERNAHVQTSALVASPRCFIADLRENLRQADLRAADVFLQIGSHPAEASTNDPDQSVRTNNRRVFELSLELCAALDCSHMTGLPGVPHGDPQRDFALAAEEAQWRLELCHAARVTYAIEPHIGSICASVMSTRKLLEAVPGLTLTLDYGHFVASGVSSDAIHPLLLAASHLHVRGGAPQRLQTSVAENTIDFAGILRRLRSMGFGGVFALEYVCIDWMECNRTDTLSETILLRRALEAEGEALQRTEAKSSTERRRHEDH